LRLQPIAIVLMATLGLSSPALSASLRVAPVLIDLSAPTATSNIRVWNDAPKAINVQVRIFRWSQRDGQDVFTPAENVVASPPITQLKPGGENMVRIVRTSKEPVKGEESYRMIVDELPPAGKQAATVVMVVRHSIPVFFADGTASSPAVSWSIKPVSGGYNVSAENRGDRRFKLANLSLTNGGTAVAKRDGLVGYVLGRSTATWFVPANGKSVGALTIHGENEAGGFDAKAKLQGG
jgi:fimbrial chaperone protein